MQTRKGVIRRRALRLSQDARHPLYLLALRADEILDLADISRISRDDAGALIGYQRPEVKKHVQNIVDYLNSTPDILFPHALILAFDSSVSFTAARGPKVDDVAEAGTLTFRLPRNGAPRPAWIVDGQQRALALSRCKKSNLPVPVAAFVSDDLETQRDQFLRVNQSRPLPRGLVGELLPKVNALLPPNLAARRAPAALVELLNQSPASPFYRIIRRSSDSGARRKAQVVADTVLTQVLADNLQNTSGCLFAYRDLATGETDYNAVSRVLLLYWNAVKTTWPEAWGKPPTQSRLMHGAGLRAMGKLMDRMMGTIYAESEHAQVQIEAELSALRGACAWTAGDWDFGMRWNEIQNVPQHIRLLSNHLIRAYLGARQH